jgi:predicted TIM-barrel fold metal-dependent hydrolase
MIDTNVYLSRWPCRRLAYDETARLADKLRASGIKQAWAGSFDALLHKDITAVNDRLAAGCAKHADLLLPFGGINLALPDWQFDVRRCREQHGIRGIRLHPDYHGYTLQDPRFAELLKLAAESKLIVQVAVRMEDDRTQHPLLRVPAVDLAPLPALLKAHPSVQIQLLNSGRDVTPEVLSQLAECPNAWIEFAMTEGVGGVAQLSGQFPFDRILMGTYAPFFSVESSLLKLDESELGDALRARIVSANAGALLSATTRT